MVLERSGCKAHDSWVFSKIETEKICRQVHKRGIQVKFLFDDGDQHVGRHGATQICVFTAFSLVAINRLIRRCCLIHLKNNSTCQRLLYKAAMVNAGNGMLLVKNTSVLPDCGSLCAAHRAQAH